MTKISARSTRAPARTVAKGTTPKATTPKAADTKAKGWSPNSTASRSGGGEGESTVEDMAFGVGGVVRSGGRKADTGNTRTDAGPTRNQPSVADYASDVE